LTVSYLIILGIIVTFFIGLDYAFACHEECYPADYEFGLENEVDFEVIICLDREYSRRATLDEFCPHAYTMIRSEYLELEKLWPNKIKPNFQAVSPDFKQFTDDDIFCLLDADDFSQCIGQNGPLHNIDVTKTHIDAQYAYCRNTAKNLLSIDKITRTEFGNVDRTCKQFAEYLLKFRNTVEPFDKAINFEKMEKEEFHCLHLSTTPEKCKYYVAGPFGFVDRTKNSEYYLEKYFNEPEYKEWFDENYEGYTIYQALGITEDFANSNIEVKSKKIEKNPIRIKLNECKQTQRECNEMCGLGKSSLCTPQECLDSRGCTQEYVSSLYAQLNAQKEQEIVFEENTQDKADSTNDDSGGGCLIATATYGSELSPQVQQLRELRDNKLLQTESGSAFMESFNDFYYSFSPGIADFERENPYFKEAVKLAITPMISSLSILNNVDMDTEAEVLGYGISLILLNIGMYVGIPAISALGIRKRF